MRRAMAKSLLRSHALLLPLVLLVMVLLEELATVEVRYRIQSLPVRVAVLMALYGVGFSIAAGWIVPWLKGTLVRARRGARPLLGHWGFYLAAYGVLFGAYYYWESHGGVARPSKLVADLWR